MTVDFSDIRAEDLTEYTIVGRQWYDGVTPITGATTNLYYLAPEAARTRVATIPLRFRATYKNTAGYLYNIETQLTVPELAIAASEPSFAFDDSSPARQPGTLTAQLSRALPVDWEMITLELINNADGQRPQKLRTEAPVTLPYSWGFNISAFAEVYDPNFGGQKFPGPFSPNGWRNPPYYQAHGLLRQKNGEIIKLTSPRRYNEDAPFTSVMSLAAVSPSGPPATLRPGTTMTLVTTAQRDYNGEFELLVQWEVSPTPTAAQWVLLSNQSLEQTRQRYRLLRAEEIAGQHNYMRARVIEIDRFAGTHTVTVAPFKINAPTTGQLSISIMNNLMTADGYVTLITSEIQDANGGEFVSYNWYFIKPISGDFGIQQVQESRKQISQLDMALLNMGLQLNVAAVFRDSLGFLTTLTAQADYQQMARQGNEPTQGTITLAGPLSWYPGAVFTVETAGLTDANGLGTLSYHWWAEIVPGQPRALTTSTSDKYTLALEDWAGVIPGTPPRLRVSIVHTDQAFYEQVFEATREHHDTPPRRTNLNDFRLDGREHH